MQNLKLSLMNPQQPHKNYYFNDNGLLVFTEYYLSQRGYCCGNGCRHCPYHYINVPDELKQQLNIQNKIEISND